MVLEIFSRVPWTARRSSQSILNQSWIFIGRTEAKADTPVLWPPDAKNWTEKKCKELDKILMLGKIEGRRQRGQQRMRRLDGITNSMSRVWASSRSWWWTGKPGMLQSMRLQRWTWLSNWNELYCFYHNHHCNHQVQAARSAHCLFYFSGSSVLSCFHFWFPISCSPDNNQSDVLQMRPKTCSVIP